MVECLLSELQLIAKLDSSVRSDRIRSDHSSSGGTVINKYKKFKLTLLLSASSVCCTFQVVLCSLSSFFMCECV
jgi:hypothetical protein